MCARDTGIYLGFVIGLLVLAALDRGRRRTEVPPPWVLALGAVLVAVMGWDGVTSYAGLRPTTNLIRLATGLGTGFALTLVIVPLLNAQLWRRRSPERVLGETWEVAVWAAAIPLSFVAIWWGGPALGTAYAVLTAVAILVTLTAVNLVLVLVGSTLRAESGAPARRLAADAAGARRSSALEIAAADWLRYALQSFVAGR